MVKVGELRFSYKDFFKTGFIIDHSRTAQTTVEEFAFIPFERDKWLTANQEKYVTAPSCEVR